MPSSEYDQRFGGINRLYGTLAQERIHQAHALIIGIGGVGSWAGEALVRSGIGKITLMDLDDICITNTNRQVHTQQNTIGHAKTDTLKQRLELINPECDVTIIDDFLELENIAHYVVSNYSVVIDAIDLFFMKAALIHHCKRNKIPIIVTGSSGGKRDPSKITFGDLTKTFNDPLLAKVRNTLRRQHHFTKNLKRSFGIEAIYSAEQMTYPDDQGETSKSKAYINGSTGLDCSSGFGASCMITASVGLLAASRAIEKIIE